jgi:hypothetical protein
MSFKVSLSGHIEGTTEDVQQKEEDIADKFRELAHEVALLIGKSDAPLSLNAEFAVAEGIRNVSFVMDEDGTVTAQNIEQEIAERQSPDAAEKDLSDA